MSNMEISSGPPLPTSKGLIAARQSGSNNDNCVGGTAFTCAPTASCYTGPMDTANGDLSYVGCCDLTQTCVARTTCYDSTSSPAGSCDSVTGGCIYCSNSQYPYCNLFSNILAGQFYQYCDATSVTATTNFVNSITGGSIAALPGSTTPTLTGSPTGPSTASGASITNAPTASSSSPTSTAAPVISQPGSSTPLGAGDIAGIAVGAAAGAAIAGYLLCRYLPKRKSKGNLPKSPSMPETGFRGPQDFLDQSRGEAHRPVPLEFGSYNAQVVAPPGVAEMGMDEQPNATSTTGAPVSRPQISPAQVSPLSTEHSFPSRHAPMMSPVPEGTVLELAGTESVASDSPAERPIGGRYYTSPSYHAYRTPLDQHQETASMGTNAERSHLPGRRMVSGLHFNDGVGTAFRDSNGSTEVSTSQVDLTDAGRRSGYLSPEDAMSLGYRDT